MNRGGAADGVRYLDLTFEPFGWELVEAGAARRQVSHSELIRTACVRYLARPRRRSLSHRPPGFGDAGGETRTLAIDGDPALWEGLEREASAYEVDLERVVEHAVILDSAPLGPHRRLPDR
jgi:hypothetical protein